MNENLLGLLGTQTVQIPPQCACFLEFCDMHAARWGCERRQVREDNEAISGVFTFCQSEHWKVFITIIYIALKEKRF